MTTSNVTINELLQTTSRTFALSIPLLPRPLDWKVTLAYLVFRISDTLEDAERLNRTERQAGLDSFCELLNSPSEKSVDAWTNTWASKSISDNDDYNRLLNETPQVLAAVRDLDDANRNSIVRHAQRSAQGMSDFLDRADEQANLSLLSIQDLREYCYYVAGIVGELITELFVLEHQELADTSLAQNAAAFGEGLQLVNILKDSSDDAVCGRAYLPAGIPLDAIYELAFDDLEKAETYVETLRHADAPGGYIAFCDTPIQLAKATLTAIRRHGPGSKVPREQMFQLPPRRLRTRRSLGSLGNLSLHHRPKPFPYRVKYLYPNILAIDR